MNRWTAAARAHRARLALAGLLCLAAAAGPVRAQLQRAFPDTALRGQLVVSAPPLAQLDGRDDRMAVGVRIRDQDNRFVTTATLADGQPRTVHYLRNAAGEIGDVWLLNAAEAAVPRATAHPGWLQRWFGL